MRVIILIGLALFATPACADAMGDIERELAASSTGPAALVLAQQHADQGRVLEALATVERARFLDPKLKQARLLHAVLLCRLDDPQGAAVEWDGLKKKDYKKNTWKEAKASCPALFGGRD